MSELKSVARSRAVIRVGLGDLNITFKSQRTQISASRLIYAIEYSPYATREDAMPTRELALCFALSGLTASAAAQNANAPERWTPISRMAQTITGHVTFTPSEITFQNGKSLPLARASQMLFRSEAKKKRVVAEVYRVTSPDVPVLENGNKLCKGKPVAYLIVFKSEKIGNEADPRTMAPFFGQDLNGGSRDDCGRFIFDAGQP
jgi:hypothetical protein